MRIEYNTIQLLDNGTCVSKKEIERERVREKERKKTRAREIADQVVLATQAPTRKIERKSLWGSSHVTSSPKYL